MVEWHQWLDRHEFEQAPGVGDGQGGLVCCSPWGCKESDTSEWLNWIERESLFVCLSLLISKEFSRTISSQQIFNSIPLAKLGQIAVSKQIAEKEDEIESLIYINSLWLGGSLSGSDGKEFTCHAGDPASNPGSGSSPGEGNGNPLQYSCLENLMDRGNLVSYSPWGCGVRHDLTTKHRQACDSLRPLSLITSPSNTWRRSLIGQQKGIITIGQTSGSIC